jgi:hypothetical protein
MFSFQQKHFKFVSVFLIALFFTGALPWRELRADANTRGEYSCSSFSVVYEQTSSWDINTQGEFVITNTSDAAVDSWKFQLEFSSDLSISNIWNGVNLTDENTPSNVLIIGNEVYNSTIEPGASVSFGLIMTGSEFAPVSPTSVTLIEEAVPAVTEEPVPVEESVTFQDINPGSYLIFTRNDLSISGYRSNIQGNVYAGNSFNYSGSELSVGGTIRSEGTVNLNGCRSEITTIEETAPHQDIPNLSEDILVRANDLTNLDASALSSQTDIVANGYFYSEEDINISSSTFGGEVIIVSEGNITFNVDSISDDGNIVLYSVNGDITINASQTVFNGLIYAPNGRVSFNCGNITVVGRIIANDFFYNGSILTVTADPIFIPETEVPASVEEATPTPTVEPSPTEAPTVTPMPTENENPETTPSESSNPDSEENTEINSEITVWSSRKVFGIDDDTENVILYLSAPIDNIASVEVFEDGSQLATLVDNGDVNDCDDVSGDGIYSGGLVVDTSSCHNINYTLQLTTTDGTHVSVDYTVYIIDLDDDYMVLKTLWDVSDEYYFSDEYDEDSPEIRKETLVAMLEQLERDGLVEVDSIAPSDDGNIYFYTDFGAMIVFPFVESDSNHNSFGVSDMNNGIVEIENTIPDVSERGDVLYLIAFQEEDNRDEDYRSDADFLGQYGVSVDLDFRPSYDDYCNCLDCGYSVVVFSGHGGYSPDYGTVILDTGILVSIYNDSLLDYYRGEALQNNVALSRPTNERPDAVKVFLLPGFFTGKYADTQRDTIVLFENCYSFGSDSPEEWLEQDIPYCQDLGYSLSDIGVEYCIGFTNTVVAGYSRDFYRNFILYYCSNNSAYGSYHYAGTMCGFNDSGYENDQYISTPIPFGDSGHRITTRTIENSSFENQGEAFGTIDSLFNWDSEGYVRVLRSLGGIGPTDGNHMAFITSGDDYILNSHGSTPRVYTMADLDSEPTHYNVTFAVDTSSNMDDTEHQEAIRTINTVLANLEAGDRVSVCTMYGDYIRTYRFTDASRMPALSSACTNSIMNDQGNGRANLFVFNEAAEQNYFDCNLPDDGNVNIIIFITDDNSVYSRNVPGVRLLIEHSYSFYTVFVGNSYNPDLADICNSHRGEAVQAYQINDGIDESAELFFNISTRDFAWTDGDGDGLPDMIEEDGMMSLSGEIYYSDPNRRDSDGDNVVDGIEMGEMYQILRLDDDTVEINGEQIGISEITTSNYSFVSRFVPNTPGELCFAFDDISDPMNPADFRSDNYSYPDVNTQSQVTNIPNSLSQSFCVPDDCDCLLIDVNMITEEPVEAGFQYDDEFEIIIQDLDTGAESIVYTNSVNSADWTQLPEDDVDYPVYQTGWFDVRIDLNGYQNHNVRIVFTARNEGDSLYDTAVLLDNLRFG